MARHAEVLARSVWTVVRPLLRWRSASRLSQGPRQLHPRPRCQMEITRVTLTASRKADGTYSAAAALWSGDRRLVSARCSRVSGIDRLARWCQAATGYNLDQLSAGSLRCLDQRQGRVSLSLRLGSVLLGPVPDAGEVSPGGQPGVEGAPPEVRGKGRKIVDRGAP